MEHKLKEKMKMCENQIKDNLKLVYHLKQQNRNFNDVMEKIWAWGKEKYILQTKLDKDFKKYKGIIFTVGFRPEPIILNILANNPQAVYFINTKESAKFLDRIIDETNLKASQFKRGTMPMDSVLASFRSVKEGFNFLNDEMKIAQKHIALDPTAGTKMMSVGAALATIILDLDILYVSNTKYNISIGAPEPGKEKLKYISDLKDILKGDKLINEMEISEKTYESLTRYFKDISNTHLIILSEIESSVTLSSIKYLKTHKLDDDLYSGFIDAISKFWMRLKQDLEFSELKESGSDFEINYKDYKITILNSKYIRLIIISDQNLGNLFREKTLELIEDYEKKHEEELKEKSPKISKYNDFPKMAKDALDLQINEECIIDTDKLRQYNKNSTVKYVLKMWNQKMISKGIFHSFYPFIIPKQFIRELGMSEEEACYWTYDLLKHKVFKTI